MFLNIILVTQFLLSRRRYFQATAFRQTPIQKCYSPFESNNRSRYIEGRNSFVLNMFCVGIKFKVTYIVMIEVKRIKESQDKVRREIRNEALVILQTKYLILPHVLVWAFDTLLFLPLVRMLVFL